MLQKRLSLAIDEGLRDLQEIDWAEQHRLLASEFGETGGGELDGLPALQDRFDQPRAHKGEKIVVIAPTDVSELGNLTRTGAEQLRRAGIR